MAGLIQIILGFISSLFGARKPEPITSATKIGNIDHIKKWEGYRGEAYKPTKDDVWTIGWGHTTTAKEGMKITEEEAEELFRWDLEWVEDAINDLVTVPVSQKQFDALASLTYNIGRTQFRNSSVLRRLNNGDYHGAGEAFLMWNKQRNKEGTLTVLRGLTRRRSEEMEMFYDGTTTKN